MADTLIGRTVIHKSFGVGKIILHKDNKISVQFSDESTRLFVYPDIFRDNFLEAVDLDFLDQVTHDIQVKQSEREKELLRYQSVKPASSNSKRNTPKVERSNAAFKCTYCNGGKIPGVSLGFNGVCSDDIIRYNVEVDKKPWCSNKMSLCKNYLEKQISRARLESYLEDSGFVCYESVMFRDWKAYAGVYQSGENKGKPMKLKQVQANSLAVLTTREPNTPESQRFIFAIFLVDESYEGDDQEEGYVTTLSDWKIELTPAEAHKILFWNYYANDNSPETPHWGTGLFRYISDDQAIQILRDIIAVKKKQSDKDFAQQFLDHYCAVNKLNKTNVAPPSGALLLGST